MKPLNAFWISLRSLVLSVFKRSFRSHGSVRIRALADSMPFYRALGFRQVSASRGQEVIMLRNHLGDEVNLIVQADAEGASRGPGSVSFEVHALERFLDRIDPTLAHTEVLYDAVSKRACFVDPDGNRLEFFELLAEEQRAERGLFHVATEGELKGGLSEHYYMPPESARRFLRCRPRSNFIALTCGRVAQDTESPPLVIEMDQSQVSIEEVHTEFASRGLAGQSTYAHVLSPVPRQAIVAVGRCEEVNGEYRWPDQFVGLEALSV